MLAPLLPGCHAMEHTCCKSIPGFKVPLFGRPLSFSPAELFLLVMEGPLQLLTWAILRQHHTTLLFIQDTTGRVGMGETEGTPSAVQPCTDPSHPDALESTNGLSWLRNLLKHVEEPIFLVTCRGTGLLCAAALEPVREKRKDSSYSLVSSLFSFGCFGGRGSIWPLRSFYGDHFLDTSLCGELHWGKKWL